jgi:lysophospholipase L1-like esterase
MKDCRRSRRSFIKKAAMASFAAVAIPEIISAAMPQKKYKRIIPEKDNVILFQGDSITDAGRNRENKGFNNAGALGSGYVLLAAAGLLEKYPNLNLSIYNKGISGNKVFQLADRWDDDCLDLKPDVLSILIGVNDFWHKLDGSYDGTVETYRKDFFALMERTKRALPSVRVIIGEPFAVPGIRAVNEKWYPEFYEFQKAAKEVADSFGALFMPYQRIFDEAIKRAPGVYWTGDGVHASLAGAQLMAKAWMSLVK